LPYTIKINLFSAEDPPSTGSDVEKQLLEAARSGDMEVVKVSIHKNVCDAEPAAF